MDERKEKNLVWLRPNEWWCEWWQMRVVDRMGTRQAESVDPGEELG